MTDTATLQAQLSEAETALHQLATGKSSVSVGYDGKTVTYTATSMPQLQVYIRGLKQQLGILPKRSARRVYF